jgi:hypothetical protein
MLTVLQNNNSLMFTLLLKAGSSEQIKSYRFKNNTFFTSKMTRKMFSPESMFTSIKQSGKNVKGTLPTNVLLFGHHWQARWLAHCEAAVSGSNLAPPKSNANSDRSIS